MIPKETLAACAAVVREAEGFSLPSHDKAGEICLGSEQLPLGVGMDEEGGYAMLALGWCRGCEELFVWEEEERTWLHFWDFEVLLGDGPLPEPLETDLELRLAVDEPGLTLGY